LASFSFHVPMFMSAARQTATAATNTARVIRIVFGFMFPPLAKQVLVCNSRGHSNVSLELWLERSNPAQLLSALRLEEQ